MDGNEIEQMPDEATDVPQVSPQEPRRCPHDGSELVGVRVDGGDLPVEVCRSCGTHFTEEELKRRNA